MFDEHGADAYVRKLKFCRVLLILGPWEYIGEDKWQEPRLIFLARVLSLLSGVCAGIIGPLVRALPNVHVLEMLTWLGALGVAVSVTIAIFFDSMWWFFVTIRHAPITAVLFVTVLGLAPYMGRLCLNMAWQAESAATVTLVFVNVWVALQYLAQVLIMKVSADNQWINLKKKMGKQRGERGEGEKPKPKILVVTERGRER